jgi:hypothetical protein
MGGVSLKKKESLILKLMLLSLKKEREPKF